MNKDKLLPPPSSPLLRAQAYLLKRNIAGFKLFKNNPLLLHGFTYGKGSQNMSYKWEPGYTDKRTRGQAIRQIKQRIEQHLSAMGMEDITKSVYLQALSGDTRIIDLSTASIVLSKKTDRGIFMPGGAIFTTLPRIPILMTSGDCHTLTVHGINQLGIHVIGLIHAGRRELDAGLPRNALAHLTRYYSCDPLHITVGVVQGIGPENHTIQPEHIMHELKNFGIWAPYISQPVKNGPYHLDNLKLLFDQIQSVYIPGENIEAYTSDNVVLAQNGKSFSHRVRQGRILISVQLQ